MAKVFIDGLEFFGRHGVSAAEKETGHRMSLQIEMDVDSNADATDRIEDTVDYAAVGALALEVATARPRNTIESVAGEICDAILSGYPRVRRVRTTIRKLEPPVPFTVEAVGVTIERDART